jgi:cell division protein FtsA
MARQTIIGIDIGSTQTKAIIAEGVFNQGHLVPKIIGTGVAESKGVERGYITNFAEAAQGVRLAVSRAEKTAGIKAKKAYVSFGGLGLGSITMSGSVAISRADMEIAERDLTLALEAAEASIPPALLINKRVINTIPVEYKIDGKPVWGQAVGLKAQKLEVKALFITCLEHHLAELIKTLEDAGLEVIDVVAAPIAASLVTVSKRERRVGCLLADIGAETLSIVVFENNNLISLEVFPLGGTDITNDIALGLKVPLEEAESIKLGGPARTAYSKKKLDEIISARLGDCFELVENHLKKIGRDSLLPAGVILTGGTASTSGIKPFAEDFLNLPAHVAEIHFGTNEKSRIRENIWATACGLALLGFSSGEKDGLLGESRGLNLPGIGGGILQKISRLISQILP